MTRIKFKCKGKLEDGSPCDRYVSTKMHTGVLDGSRGIKEMVADIKGNTVQTDDDGVADIPSDWEFTLICSCSTEHEDDYSYGERER